MQYEPLCDRRTPGLWRSRKINFSSCLGIYGFSILILCFGFWQCLLFADEQSKSAQADNQEIQTSVPAMKKILVLSSHGGYGHTAAANTLIALLGKQYQFSIYHPIDQVHVMGIPLRENFYNASLKHGWIRTMNFIARHIAPGLFNASRKQIEEMIDGWIEKEKPDLVISIIPFVNYPATEAARKRNIPYLLITTDNDLRNWSFRLEKLRHPNFKITIGADLPLTRGLLLKKKISNSVIETIGLPLRLDFTVRKNEEKLREEYNIPQDKAVVLIIMGGAGSKTALDYASKIAQMDLSLHMIVCAGRNESLKKKLEKIDLHPSNSMTVMSFTEKIADLMTMSDLIITKPGPGTINEAIAMQLPVLVDNTSTSLYWERVNSDMVIYYGIGDRIKKYKDIQEKLVKYLKDDKVKASIDEAFAAIPPNQFHEKIGSIINEMASKPDKIAAVHD